MASNNASSPVTFSFMNYTSYPITLGLRNFSASWGNGGQSGLSNVTINGSPLTGANTATIQAATGGAPGQLQMAASFNGTPMGDGNDSVGDYEYNHQCNPYTDFCLVPGSDQATGIENDKSEHENFLDNKAARLDILFASGGNYAQFIISGVAWRQSNQKTFTTDHHNYVYFFNGFLKNINTFYSYDHKQEITVCANVTYQNGTSLTTSGSGPSTLATHAGAESYQHRTYPKSYTFSIYPYGQAQCAKYYPYQDGKDTNTGATPNVGWINN